MPSRPPENPQRNLQRTANRRKSPYSVEVIGMIDSRTVDGEKLRASLQRVLAPYGLTVKVLGGRC